MVRLAEAQLGCFAQALWAHLCEIDRGAKRKQPLVRADVAGGLLAANVLLAGLQREHPAAAAAAIHGLTRDATGHAAYELLFAGHDSQIRTAVEQRSTERLPFGDSDVGAEIAGPLQQAEADWI